MLPRSHAQETATRICVVQVKEGFEGTSTVQESGADAIGLTSELSTRKTKNGLLVPAILLFRMPRKEVDSEVDMQQCGYVVELWRHISADDAGTGGAYPVEPSGDRDMVEYQLRKAGSRKVLASGAAPPLIVHGPAHWVSPSPYPLIATSIMKKINP